MSAFGGQRSCRDAPITAYGPKRNTVVLLLCDLVVFPRDRQRAREISVARSSTKFENARSNGLDTVAAWANYSARVSGKLADA